MADFLDELASGAGLEHDQAHRGVGALLALVKDRIGPEAYAHLQNAIPNAEHMLSGFQDKAGSGGGLMDALKGMAGKFLGPQGSAALQQHLAGTGLSVDQFHDLLPQLHEMLAGKIPPQVLEQIKQHVPGFGPAVEHAEQP